MTTSNVSSSNFTTLYSGSGGNATIPQTANTAGNAGNVATQNFTTLYSGSNSINPAQPYGNANVVGLLSVGTDGANTIGNISATGNISANYFIGNGSQLTGIAGSYGNANVAVFMANFGSNVISTTGNVTAGYFLGNGSQLTGLPAVYGNANVVALLSNLGSNTISTTGNVTAGYFIGDGSQLSNISGANIVGGYGNANVAAYLPTFGGNILFGNLLLDGVGGNATIGPGTGNTRGMVIKNESGNGIVNSIDVNDLVVSIYSVDPINGGTANVVVDGAYGVYFRTTNTANIQRSWDFLDTGNTFFPGTLRLTNAVFGNSVIYTNVDGTAGQVLTTYGNGVTYFDTVSTYGNANVAAYLPTFGGNILFGNLLLNGVGGNATIGPGTGPTAGMVIKNDSGNGIVNSIDLNDTKLTLLSVDPLNVGNATIDIDGAYGVTIGTINSSGNVKTWSFIDTGNTFFPGPLRLTNGTSNVATGVLYPNVDGTAGQVLTTYGNGITYFDNVAAYGNANVVALLSNLGSNTISTTGTVTTGNVQAGNLRTTGLISATGNITGSAIFTGGNSMVGNLDINLINSGANGIQIIPDSSTLTSNISGAQPGRVVFGNGIAGNLVPSVISIETAGATRLVTFDQITLPQSQTNPQRVSGQAGQLTVDLGGSTWTNKRASGYRFDLQLANGTASTNNYVNIRAAAFNVGVGDLANTGIGTGNAVTVSGVTSGTTVAANSAVTTGTNFIGLHGFSFGGATSTLTNSIGFAGAPQWNGATANTVINFYCAGVGNPYGLNSPSTAVRSAANYYAFKNDDAVAQVQLGTLRSYNEFNAVAGNTAGSITFDKATSQVHQVNLTGNVTSITYANMVTSLSDGFNTDEELDTLTLIFNQGTTGGFDVTFPTGSTYKYAGNVTALTSTAANSVSVVQVQAVGIGGVPTFLTTINPAFV